MRSAVALAFIAGTLALAPGQASPMPLALGDHAALSRYMNGAVMQVSHRHVCAQRHRAAPLQLAVLSLLAALSVLLLAPLLSVWRSAVLNALHQPAAKCFMGIAATAITPIAATIGVPGITGPTPTAITGRIATAIGGGPIIAVTGSLAWIDQGRSASRWS